MIIPGSVQFKLSEIHSFNRISVNMIEKMLANLF